MFVPYFRYTQYVNLRLKRLPYRASVRKSRIEHTFAVFGLLLFPFYSFVVRGSFFLPGSSYPWKQSIRNGPDTGTVKNSQTNSEQLISAKTGPERAQYKKGSAAQRVSFSYTYKILISNSFLCFCTKKTGFLYRSITEKLRFFNRLKESWRLIISTF